MVVAQRKHHYNEQEIYWESPKANDQQRKEKKNRAKHKIKAINKVQMIFSLLLMAMLCIGILLGYVQLTELKYKVNNLSNEIRQLEAYIENLRVEVEKVERSDIIEEKAKVELGMQYPLKEQMVFLDLDHGALENVQNTQEKSVVKEEENGNSLILDVKNSFYKVFSLLD
ncbi:cell division protein FtsL [Clostridiaceae bacterium 35-E11]